jgi:peptide/nickel transport system substrate-binding protein
MNHVRPRRNRLGLFSLLAVLFMLAACGGGGSKTPTPPPVVTPTPTVPATTAPTPIASPLASPVGSPVAGASPVSANETASISRADFQKQLLAAYPMEDAKHTGGTILLAESGDISTVNGILANDSTTINMLSTIFEPLVGVSPIDGRPVPSLADSWESSADGLTYTFHLNTKAKWQDGVDFTADDVKFSFDAVLDPNTGSSYASTVKAAVASYRVIDPDTFEITAKDRFVTFFYDVPATILIMPKHIWESVGFESWTFDKGSTGQDPSRVVGTGPFKFKEWVQGDHITVVRNDDYYDVVPKIDALTMQVLPDSEAAVTSLLAGQTDIMEIIPAAQTKSVQDTPGRKVDVYDFYQMTFYAMNLDPTKSALFQDPKVRQALYYALDRDSITRNIFLGFGEAAVGTQPKLSAAYAPDKMTPSYAFDPEKAKALMAEAGWTLNSDGKLEKDGKQFSFSLSYGSGDATTDQIVAYMQQAWAAIGIKVNLDGVDSNAWLNKLKSHDYDMTLIAFNLGLDGSQEPLFSCAAYKTGFNFMDYCNPAWDALNEQQKREFDPAKRDALLVQQSEIIWQDQPIGPIRFGIARTGYNSRIHNFYPNGYGLLWSLPYMWVDPA